MIPAQDAIAAAIGESTGIPFAATSIEPVGCGSIHRAWHLDDGVRHFFVKTGTASVAPVLEAEACGLQALAATGALRIPTLISQGRSGDETYLILDYVKLVALDQRGGALLGTSLARLHRVLGNAYGWHENNYIGTTPQDNSMHPSWPHFYGERRLRPQLQFALSHGMNKALVAKGHAVIERIGGLFIDYSPLPSLLHGDLWSGNAAQCSDGAPLIFDPACYWGDRETDLAMAELFGGFPTSFFAAYRSEWSLDPGYESRKTLYNLYHILNHFNLFGNAYLGQAQRMIDRLLADLRC